MHKPVKTVKPVKKLVLSKETLRLLSAPDLSRIAAATCWETIALPCGTENKSENGCVSGNLC